MASFPAVTIHSTEVSPSVSTYLFTLNSELSKNKPADMGNATHDIGKGIPECIYLPNASFLPQVDMNTALVSHTTEKVMYQVVQLVASWVICIVGIPTNFINVIVFLKMGLKDRVNLCLFWLSFCDMMSLLAHTLRSGELMTQFLSGDTTRLHRSEMARVLYDYGLGTIAGFRQISFFMYALIALDRCLSVVMPMRIRQLLTDKFVTTTVILGSVISFAFNAFTVMAHGTLCVILLDSGVRGYYLSASKFFQKHPQLLRISFIMDGFVLGLALPILFLSTVIISTVITTIILLRRKDWFQQATSFSSTPAATRHDKTTGRGSRRSVRSNSSGQEVAITRMLIIVSSVYIFCTVPVFVHRFARFVVPGFFVGRQYGNLMKVTFYIISLLTNINSAVNFFVFYWQGTRFRNQLHDLFCMGCCTCNLRKSLSDDCSQHDRHEVSSTRATAFVTRQNEAAY